MYGTCTISFIWDGEDKYDSIIASQFSETIYFCIQNFTEMDFQNNILRPGTLCRNMLFYDSRSRYSKN